MGSTDFSTMRISGDEAEDPGPRAFLIRIAGCHHLARPAPLIVELSDLKEVQLVRGEQDAITPAPRQRAAVEVADPSMSARHARIVRVKTPEGPLHVLRDMGSTNGCLVNGVRVDGGQQLEHGDILETGQTFWKLWVGDVARPDQLLEMAYQGGSIELTSSVCLEVLEALSQLRQVAPTDLSVVIQGESGTGKEGMARELHERSGRRGSFVALNCAAVPENLIESELFGHRKGAFSGAVADKPGLIETAEGGTLLLDEVGDMPLALQAKLLRVLQERSFLRVGETSTRHVDVRFVAATHRDLRQMVEDEAFRGDLFARLNGLTVQLPPLRDRREDLGIIIAALLARQHGGEVPGISQEALRALLLHDWPFNVRELQQCLAVAVAFAGKGQTVKLMHLPAEVRQAVEAVERPAPTPAPPAPRRTAPTREELLELLAREQGNISAVARALQTTRMQIHRWMKRYDIDPERYR